MQIIVPKFDTMSGGKKRTLLDEMRWGKFVADYIEREKGLYRERIKPSIEKYKGFQQNNKSEFQLDMTVDARVYMRWLKEDPNFWNDPANVKKFKKDNPECQPWKR